MDSEELLVVLLTGGGLALIGTVLGALITQVFTVRIGREARRDERRLALKSFQRDTLVALQDSVNEINDLFSAAIRTRDDPDDSNNARRDYRTAAYRVRMLASRVRDEELRSAASDLLDGYEMWLSSGANIVNAATARQLSGAMRVIYDRAGELIRTLDAIDEASDTRRP